MATATTAGTAFATLRHALETNDADEAISAFADDAVLISYSERNRPGAAHALEGREAIAEMLRDVVARDLQHEVTDEVIGDDRFSCIERCRYPTGERVVTTFVCHVRDGKIVRQEGCEAWDE